MSHDSVTCITKSIRLAQSSVFSIWNFVTTISSFCGIVVLFLCNVSGAVMIILDSVVGFCSIFHFMV
jgi:hypothetical protein